MKVKISGGNMEVGSALTEYSEEKTIKNVGKYFQHAISAHIHFNKEGGLFFTSIHVDEGAKHSIVMKARADASDVYASFDEALKKIVVQLRRYKDRLDTLRKRRESIAEEQPLITETSKYVIDYLNNVIEEEEDYQEVEQAINIVEKKTTKVDKLDVREAIMQMDLASLPALMFINRETDRINLIYRREDGNISWIDTEGL